MSPPMSTSRLRYGKTTHSRTSAVDGADDAGADDARADDDRTDKEGIEVIARSRRVRARPSPQAGRSGRGGWRRPGRPGGRRGAWPGPPRPRAGTPTRGWPAPG